MIALVLLILAASVVYLYWRRKKVPLTTGEHGRGAEKALESDLNPADRALQSRLGLTTRCRPVTIAANQALLVAASGDALAKVVRKLSSFTPMYILCEVSSDEEETSFRRNLMVLVPEFPPHHILFYGSEVGKTAIVRQVTPSIHIDPDLQFCLKLRPHLRCIVLLDCAGSYGDSSLDTTVDGQPVTTVKTGSGAQVRCGADRISTTQEELSEDRGRDIFPRISMVEQLLDLDLNR